MENICITIIVGLFCSILAYHIKLQYGRLGRLVNKLPGPTVIPLLGNLLSLHVPLTHLNALFREWGRVYYPAYRVWFGGRATISIVHPDDIEIMLTSTKNLDREFTYEYLRPWLKTGLLTSPAEKWQKRRKTLTPAFHFNILKRYMDVTNEQGNRIIENVKAAGDEATISLILFCSDCTLNIICETAMGVSLDMSRDKESAENYKQAIYKMGQMVFYRLVRPYMKDWMIPYLPRLNTELNENFKHLNDFVNKIMEERREYHKSTGYRELQKLEDDDKDNEFMSNLYMGKRKRLAILDLLLAAEKDGLIDDEGIKEEVATFVFAGHDTTAMAMCFTIMLLAENKQAQNLAREEVEAIMKRKNGVLETTDLQELNYLERCIKETLRLFPSVPSIGRLVTKDMRLKHCFVPKGTNLVAHFVDLHRDPNFWPQPDQFDPDRFLHFRSRKRHPFAYLPFSAGSRNCIGQKFAMMELKSLIARILYNFHLVPIDCTSDVKLLLDIVVRPDQPIHTQFIKIRRD